MTALVFRPLHEQPPTCPRWVRLGWCVLPESHGGTCLPMPESYPPATPVLLGRLLERAVTA